MNPADMAVPANPTGEFIFPSVFHASQYLRHPLGNWYIYFAPHNAPGGVELMYADDLNGPWTQYAQNPVVSNTWPGVYSVSHVSSPDAFWDPATKRLILYFHGENSVTRFATSLDGTTFAYGGTAVSTAMVDAAQPGRTSTETSYARVFLLPDDSNKLKYGMFFMSNYSDNVRRIDVAFSPDARHWTIEPTPLVQGGDAEGTNVSGADFISWHGTDYITYGSSSGTIYARALSKSFTSTGDPTPLYIPKRTPPESGRAGSPQVVTDDGTTHLFYEMGQRSATTIGHAILEPDGHRDPLNRNPADPTYASCPAPGSESFSSKKLSAGWSTADPSTTLSGGTLRVPLVPSPGPEPAASTRLASGIWELTTRLAFDPPRIGDGAGIVADANDGDSVRIALVRAESGKRIDFVWRHDGADRNAAFDSRTTVVADDAPAPSTVGRRIWLRLSDDGAYVTASYSVDGATFRGVGRFVSRAELDSSRVGVFANGAAASSSEVAAFDYARFTPGTRQLATC